MKNTKGFTLVELLVTISILGIITGMAIPLIRNIQSSQSERKFATYGKAMLSSAKLYKNSYEEDLFGHNRSGCANVKLNNLIEKDLIEDFPDKEITCNIDTETQKTEVSIVKIDGQYGYSYELYCANKGDESSIERKHHIESSRKLDTCTGEAVANVDAISEDRTTLRKVHSEQIEISSVTGIKFDKLSIDYAWVEADKLEDVMPSAIVKWNTLQFSGKDMSDSQQKDKIFNENKIITLKSRTIKTPSNKAATYALVLRINSLKNLSMDNLLVDGLVEPNYRVYGIYDVGHEYKITYNSNGGSACSPTPILQNKSGTKTLEGVSLCNSQRSNYSFTGWKIDGTNELLSNSTVIKKDTNVTAQWDNSTDKITFRFTLGSGETLKSPVVAENGTSATWKVSDQGYLMRNNAEYKSTISVGKNVSMNLPNYNYQYNLVIGKTGNVGVPGAQWKCVRGCKKSGQTFSQDPTTIADTNTIFGTNRDIVLSVNWRPTKLTVRYKLIGGDTVATNTSGKFKKKDYDIVNNKGEKLVTEKEYNENINLLNYNNSDWLKIEHGLCTAPAGKNEWVEKSTKRTFDHNADYKTQAICPDLASKDCTVELRVNWRPNKPSTPNSHHNKWVNYNYNVTATTTTTNTTILGKIYWKSNTGEITAGSAGSSSKAVNMNTSSNTTRSGNWYARACNTYASGANDNGNCSDWQYTTVKIDKKKPVLSVSGMRAINDYYRGSVLVSSECSGNTQKTGTCKSEFKVTCSSSSCNWSFDWNTPKCTDEGSGCNTSTRQTIWDFGSPPAGSNPKYPGRCGNYSKDSWVGMTYNSSNGQYTTSCKYAFGEHIRHTWTKVYFRQKDNAGNYSDPVILHSTCKWCNDVSSVCK